MILALHLISTHAPLAGRDRNDRESSGGGYGISTHAPLAGRDFSSLRHHLSRHHFNPRAPCGARPSSSLVATNDSNFNPRAPCGARRKLNQKTKEKNQFQPTRPLRGATSKPSTRSRTGLIFQPTRPLRGATELGVITPPKTQISTHAPLAGRDPHIAEVGHSDMYFNPRAPCGARLSSFSRSSGSSPFQPTRPLRGATASPRRRPV